MYWLYTALSLAAHLVLAPYFLLWPPHSRKYLPSLKQRFGLKLPSATPSGQPCIWVHAVSVGEVLAVRRLLERLGPAFPGSRIVLSTVTLAGNDLAKKRFPNLEVFFFPVDWGPIIDRFLRALNPALFISAESEFWPNFFRCLKRHGARIAIVNGRITRSSFRNYRIARTFFKGVLSQVDLFLMQTDDDARRLLDLSAKPDTVHVAGNLKYDLILEPNPRITRLMDQVGKVLGLGPESQVLVAGSTMPGEEEAVLELFGYLRGRHTNCKMILAPRHPERFDQVGDLIKQRGFRLTRRSHFDNLRLMANTPNDGPAEALLLDSVGELPYLYQLATVAFVGGSLINYGGHNLLEPAYFGRPILFGPHMENFREAAQRFLQAHGALQASDLEELKQLADRLFSDPVERDRLGMRAAEIIRSSGGALERTVRHIVDLMQVTRTASPQRH